jgi:hypothetical protein
MMEEQENRILTWLFNPHHYIAGWGATALGLVFIAVAGYVGSLTNTHFPGLLDIFLRPPAPLGTVMAMGFIDWLTFAVLIYAAGRLISGSRIRVSDVLGTQAVARFPGVVSVLVILATKPGVDHYLKAPDHLGASTGDAAAFWTMYGAVMLMEAWMVNLMYSAFRVSCNVKRDGKSRFTFFVALILGEIATKTILSKCLNIP